MNFLKKQILKSQFKQERKRYPNVVVYANIFRDGYDFLATLNRIKPHGYDPDELLESGAFKMAKAIHSVLFSEYFISLPSKATYLFGDRNRKVNWCKREWIEYGCGSLYDHHTLEVDGFIPSLEESMRRFNILAF